MAKIKKISKGKTETETENVEKSMIPEGKDVDKKVDDGKGEVENTITILFRGSCPKLTPRGVGMLGYEIGINDETGESSLRIVKNESSGAFSTKWIAVADIRTILDGVQEKTFKAVVLRDLYLKRSSNNHGFLGGILKAEGVLEALPKQPATLMLKGWEGLLEKVDALKKKKVSLSDQVSGGKNQKEGVQINNIF